MAGASQDSRKCIDHGLISVPSALGDAGELTVSLSSQSRFPFLAALVSEADRFIAEQVRVAEQPMRVIADAMNAEKLSPTVRQAAVTVINELRTIASGNIPYSDPPTDRDISRLINRTVLFLYSTKERSPKVAIRLVDLLITDTHVDWA